MKSTPKLTHKPEHREVRSDPKCSNEFCSDRATHKLLNGDDDQPFCEDCIKAVIGEMVIDNDMVTFHYDPDQKLVEVS